MRRKHNLLYFHCWQRDYLKSVSFIKATIGSVRWVGFLVTHHELRSMCSIAHFPSLILLTLKVSQLAFLSSVDGALLLLEGLITFLIVRGVDPVLTCGYAALGHTLVTYCFMIFNKKLGQEILGISFNKWTGMFSGLLVAIYAGTNLKYTQLPAAL
jgi:hypothetical protein